MRRKFKLRWAPLSSVCAGMMTYITPTTHRKNDLPETSCQSEAFDWVFGILGVTHSQT